MDSFAQSEYGTFLQVNSFTNWSIDGSIQNFPWMPLIYTSINTGNFFLFFQ